MNRILPSGGASAIGMRVGAGKALILAGCLAAGPALCAQAPAAQNNQQQPAAQSQKPAASSPSSANPFPEDTSSVPVLPTRATPDIPAASDSGSGRLTLPPDDLDPVRSPDDSTPSGGSQGYSSSLSGLDALMPGPDTDTGKGRKKGHDEAVDTMPRETARQDINVGNYYMTNKDWKGALSRFQSALVLAPEDPDVYWGLAECARNLRDYAGARANYLKVMEYDPDSRRSKDAARWLKKPEIANAGPAAGQPADAK